MLVWAGGKRGWDEPVVAIIVFCDSTYGWPLDLISTSWSATFEWWIEALHKAHRRSDDALLIGAHDIEQLVLHLILCAIFCKSRYLMKACDIAIIAFDIAMSDRLACEPSLVCALAREHWRLVDESCGAWDGEDYGSPYLFASLFGIGLCEGGGEESEDCQEELEEGSHLRW